MSDQVLDFQIKVNAETGQLTALGAEFHKTGDAVKGMGGSMDAAASQAGALFKQLIPFAGAAGIIAFFKSSIDEANAQEEALRRLGFALQSNGIDWTANKQQIEGWAQGLQNLTRFSDTEALNALGQMSRATKDLGEAQTAVKVAMGLSVATGKDLNESLTLMQGLMMGTQRSVMMAHKELGTYVGTATTAQEMLDALTAKFKDAATSEDSYAKSTKEAGHAVDELEKAIGAGLLPTVVVFANALKTVFNGAMDSVTVLSDMFMDLMSTIKGWALVVTDVVTGNAKKAVDDVKAMYKQIDANDQAYGDAITARHKAQEDGNAAALANAIKLHANKSVQETAEENAAAQKFKEIHAQLAVELNKVGEQTVEKRLAENAAQIESEKAKIAQIKGLSHEETNILLADLARLKAAKDADIKNDTANAARVEQIHLELDKKLNAIGIKTLVQKKAAIDLETQMIKDKINKEIVDETAKHALLAQADDVARAQKLALDNAAWIQWEENVSQTLKNVTDGLGSAFAKMVVENKNFADAMTQLWKNMIEQFIEQLIALIVKLTIVQSLEAATGTSGMASSGGLLSAFARAEGGTNIVDKPTLFLAGEAGPEIASFTPMSKVGHGDAPGVASKNMNGVGSGGTVAGSPGASTIQVGDIYVNLQLASLGSGDRQSMLRQLADEIRGASVDAVRFAVTSRNLAERNSQMAV